MSNSNDLSKLSIRVYNALTRWGRIDDKESLEKFYKEKGATGLKRIRGIGESAVKEIIAFLDMPYIEHGIPKVYEKGEKITDINELAKQIWVMWEDQPVHIDVVMEKKLGSVLTYLELGRFSKAIESNS